MSECGWCGQVAPIAYTDVIGMDWCVTCFNTTYDRAPDSPVHTTNNGGNQ